MHITGKNDDKCMLVPRITRNKMFYKKYCERCENTRENDARSNSLIILVMRTLARRESIRYAYVSTLACAIACVTRINFVDGTPSDPAAMSRIYHPNCIRAFRVI